MRPLSVVSDLRDAIHMACADASACGLELDQIESVIREEVALFAQEERVEAARLEHDFQKATQK